jgi:hypothetical protein
MFKTSAFHLTGGRSHAPHVVDNTLSLSLSLYFNVYGIGGSWFRYI